MTLCSGQRVNAKDAMKDKINGLPMRYQAALRKYLKQAPKASLQPAQGLGRRAIILGLETLDLARIHERAVITLIVPSDSLHTRAAMIRRAGTFFAEAITPIEKTHRAALDANFHLGQTNDALCQRVVDLATSTRYLKQEIVQRKSAEKSLKQSERHYAELLGQSGQMQEQLRLLSRQL